MTDDPTTTWLTGLVTDLGRDGQVTRTGLTPAEALVRRTTPSGAELALVGDVVVKLHHPKTDAAALGTRLRAVSRMAGADVWVQPLDPTPRTVPDGRIATVWPRVDVLTEAAGYHPWAEAGRLLAALHLAPLHTIDDGPDVPLPTDLTLDLPAHGGPARVARALAKVTVLEHPSAPLLAGLGNRLLDEVSAADAPRCDVVHGDWHLGQLARTPAGLRLLDVDDLGTGDPAWDLARPAGFWAAGLLDFGDWEAFLDAYRGAGGPAAPADGDPWPRLDLPARCAVFVSTVQALTVQPTHSADPADALLEVCARM